MARRYGKRSNQKIFFEEASALIELVNLLNSLRLKHKNYNECWNYDCQPKGRNELRRHRQRAAREYGSSGHVRAQASRFKPTDRHEAKKHHRSAQNSSTAKHRKTKSVTLSYPCTKQLKKNYKRQMKFIQPKMDKYFDDLKAQLQALQRFPSVTYQNKDIPSQTVEKQIRRQLLYDIDKLKYVRIYSLKDLHTLSKHAETGRTPVLLKSADYSKGDMKTWKGAYNIPDSQLLNRKSLKRCTKNQLKEKRKYAKDSKKSIVQKPSLQLILNLRTRTNSNNINLVIKNKKNLRKLFDWERNVLDFCLPYQCDSSSRQEQMNRQLMNLLSTKLSKSSTEKLSRNSLMQASNNYEMKLLKQQHHVRNQKLPDTPYSKTQAVYNLYDVTQFRSGVMRGFKSSMNVNLNFGKGPKTAQTMSTDETRTTNTQSGRMVGRELRYKSKVDFDSGSTSLQQSVSLGRKKPQTELVLEPCDCEPFECDPSLSDPRQQESSICDTCCEAVEYVPPPKVSYATAFKRTKQRIIDRVANVTNDVASSPRSFMKRIYDKYSGIDNGNAQQRDVGVCTCKPFIGTDEVSVLEENVDPDCTFLKRIFGSLLFNDECVVCSAEREVRKKRKFVCGPGVCIESTGLLTYVKKFCNKFKKKKKKEEKRSPFCKFFSSIFSGEKDEDKRKLLKRKAKTKKHKGDDDRKRKRKDDDPKLEKPAKQGQTTGKRQFRRATRRIREKYYRNKKLAEQQKGRFACDFYLMSLRNKPCLWVYYMCPFCYPHCLSALNIWRQLSDLLLFFVAILVWSPCILTAEILRVTMCNMF